MKKSKLFRIDLKDIARGFFVAVVTTILSGAIPVLEAGTMPKGADFKTYLFIGLAAGISYLLKNLFTNSNDQILKKEV